MKRTAGIVLGLSVLSAVVYAQATAYDYSKLYEAASPAPL